MTYRWSVDDMVARIEFVRDHSPQDLFTMNARYVVSTITSVLAVELHPITVIIKFISRILRIFVLTLVLFMILDVVWLLMWGLLMGSSRLWIMYHWLRPIFILPGILSKGREPSPLKSILSLLIISQENEPKHKISKILREIFSIKENIVIS